jgi:tetratricopeptide (TPR) repeat protein
MNLAVFANIHHTSGNDIQALEYTQRALTILKRCVLSDSLTLASVLNNMGAIQLGLGLFSDARDSFDQALKICGKTLPQGHPKRVTMEINIQRIEEIIKNSQLQS